MSFWQRLWNGAQPPAPRAAIQPDGGGVIIRTPQQLEEAMRGAMASAAGVSVTPANAMRAAAVYASVRILASAVATMPLHVKRRVNDREREDLSGHPLSVVLRRRPNSWQTPSQFRRMMQAHLLLRGNAYALIVRSRGQVLQVVPLHPDRVECVQANDLSLRYTYARQDGRRVSLDQAEVFHLVGLTLDGVHGVSPITYARETIGIALATENHGATMFRNGTRVGNVITHPDKLGPEGVENLRASLDNFRAGGANEGKDLVLEEGMKIEPLGMTAQDAQFIESRKFSRSDIAMFFGVPPSMLGDNTGSDSNWGTGLEQKSLGFVAYTLEDHLTTWEETINRDLIAEDDVYARFNRAALVKGDIKSRWEAHTKGLQWGVYSPNEIRALEDENPREGGDVYYDPPNTAGNAESRTGEQNDPSNPA